jgi:glycosyltransferase involved in cell wall biosynthesis
MIKILFVVEQTRPSRYYDQLSSYLLASGLSVSFFNMAKCDFVDKSLPVGRFQNRYLQYRYASLHLSDLLSKGDFEIVHSHELIASFHCALALIWSGRSLPFIYHRHHGDNSGFVARFMEYVIVKQADKVVFVSEAMKKKYGSTSGLSPKKTCVVDNGISIGSISSLPDKWDISLVARLRPEKGHLFFLDVVKSLIVDFPNLRIVMVGDGPEESKILNEIKQRNLSPYIEMVGHKDNPQDFMSSSLITVVPSIEESFGLTAIEAMACGSVVVASNVGGLTNIVLDGETGFLCQYGGVAHFCNAIKILMDNCELRAKMRLAAMDRYHAHYSSQKMAERYLNLYNSVLDGR